MAPVKKKSKAAAEAHRDGSKATEEVTTSGPPPGSGEEPNAPERVDLG